jgi:hypothetical protein
MTIKPGARDLLWMAVGAAILLVFTVAVLRFSDERDVGEQLALKATKIDLVGRMRTGLASAAEAEKSAVLATTDEDSRAFADRARALSAGVEQARQELSALLQADGPQDERDLLAQFSQAFVELQRIDADILSLAVKNTNLKAYALAYGPAAEALSDMGAALARLGAEGGDAAAERPQARTSAGSPESSKAALLASAAQIAALRIQTSLPPHIAAERDEKMDEMEARMAKEEHAVRRNLDALAALPSLAGNPDLATATSQWTRFGEVKKQILTLSRENTNVRSLDMSLNRKRTVLLVNQDALAALQRAVEEKRVGGTSAGRWALPR